jgi:hypothetical protein
LVHGRVPGRATPLAQTLEQRPRKVILSRLAQRPRVPGGRAVVELEPRELILECYGPLEELGRDALPAQKLEVGKHGERAGERRDVSEPLGKRGRLAGVCLRRWKAFLFASRERHALEDPRAKQVVVAGLLERAVEEVESDARVLPLEPDLAQAPEQLGPLRPRRRLRKRRLEQLHCTSGVPCGVVLLGGDEQAAMRLLRQLHGR